MNILATFVHQDDLMEEMVYDNKNRKHVQGFAEYANYVLASGGIVETRKTDRETTAPVRKAVMIT